MYKKIFTNDEFKLHKSRDRLSETERKINYHNLYIKKLINILSLKLGVNGMQTLNDLEPYTNKNPQNRPYGMNKSTLQQLYALPKYLINKPTVEYEKDAQVLVFSFPVVSFTPQTNLSKNTFTNTIKYQNGIAELTLFQLNVIYKTNSGKYSITLHQNCFEKGIRQPVFLGRCELGDTHNTHHEKVQSTFHIHMPFDKNIDLTFQNTILSAIYHCQPEVYSNQSDISIHSALEVAMKKFNIKNSLESAIDTKNTKINNFLTSSCGKEWSDKLLNEQKGTISFDNVYNLLENHKSFKPKNSVADFIESNI